MSLVLLFNSGLVLASSGAKTSSEKPQKALYQDQTVFSIQSRLVMKSDLDSYLKELATFSCFSSKLWSLKLVSLEQRPDFFSNKLKGSKLLSERSVLDKFVNLIKLQVYANGQRLSVDESFLRGMGKNSCLKSNNWSSYSQELKSLVQLELFLRNRFLLDKKAKAQSILQKMKIFSDSVYLKVRHEFRLL